MPSGRLTRRYLNQLTGDNDHLRWEAAKKLTNRGSWRLRIVLEAIARRHRSVEARTAAAYTLGFRADPRAARVLAAILSDTRENPQVRAHAAEALGHLLGAVMQTREDVEQAVLGGLADPAAEVRFWSLFAAASISLLSATDLIAQLANRDHEMVDGWWPVSTEAKWALRALAGDPDADDSLPSFALHF